MENINEAGILSAIRNSIEHYKWNVKICDWYAFNMPRTINKITLYSASKFETGDVDFLDKKKYFFNISNPMCDNASKNIDIDTKDINVRAEKVEYRLNSLIFNDYLKQWMKKKGFGSILNTVVDMLPRYGSIVLKKEKNNDLSFIELRHLYIDPSVSSKKGCYDINSSYIIEPHIMSIEEFQAMSSKWDPDAMDEINTLINERLKQGPSEVPEIRVMECYLRLPNSLFTEGAKGNSEYLIFATLNDYDIANSTENNPDYIDTNEQREVLAIERVLFVKKWVKPKYKKLDYRTVVGRQLGYGVMESAFDSQERVNEVKGDINTKMRIGSNPLFFTKDKNIEDNILTDTLPGDVIKANFEITPINLEMKDLGNYNSEEQSWTQNLRMNTNAAEVSTGENMPSGTPWRSVQQLSQAVAKFFDLVRENIGLFITEVLMEYVLPDVEKDIRKEDTLLINDQDVWQEVIKRNIENKIKPAIKRYVLQNGKYPEQEEIDELTKKMIDSYKGDPFLDILDKEFFNFDKTIYIDVTGESKNLQQRVESRINALTAISQNPAILQDPTIWKMFVSTMEDTGIALDELGLSASKTPAPMPTTADAAKTGAAAPGGIESTNQMMGNLQNNQ